jgi:outer membrane protein assembly factor BamA
MLCLLLLAFPLHAISVEGNSVLPADGIVRASGLAVGQEVTPADFDAATARLMATGLLQSVRYRYKPSPEKGFDLTFEVAEFEDLHEAKLEAPPLDETRLWEALQRSDPLLQKQIPAGDQAAAYYARALEQYLTAQGRPARVVSGLRVDASGRLVTVFRPADLPKVVAVRFQGNRALSSEALTKALEKTGPAGEYSDAAFRELLERNVRPLYEEQGRLRAAFPAISFDNGVVDVTVEEGPVYVLGRVEIACQGVPAEMLSKAAAFEPGQPANWRKISASVANMQNLLARRGYLESSSDIERTLDDRAGRVDLIVSLQKGPQTVFGELEIAGLKGDAAARARGLWKLPAGAPLDADYIQQYLRIAAADPQLRRAGFRTIGRRLRPRPDSNVTDVTVTFE